MEQKQIRFSKVDISFQSYHSTQLRPSFTALSSLQPRKDLNVNTSNGATKPSQTCRMQRMRRPWEVGCIKLPSVSCKKVTKASSLAVAHVAHMCVEWCTLKPGFCHGFCSHSKDQVCVTGSLSVTFTSSRDEMPEYIQRLNLAFNWNPHFNASIQQLRSQKGSWKSGDRGNLQWPWLQMAGFKKVCRMICPGKVGNINVIGF